MRCATAAVIPSPRSLRQVLWNLPRETYHACDTEVADIDLDSQSPVGHGVVTCASVYSGPHANFGSGPKLWIDNLDGAEVWGVCVLAAGVHLQRARLVTGSAGHIQAVV